MNRNIYRAGDAKEKLHVIIASYETPVADFRALNLTLMWLLPTFLGDCLFHTFGKNRGHKRWPTLLLLVPLECKTEHFINHSSLIDYANFRT